MAAGNPDMWQHRKRMHERYGEIPDTPMENVSEEESDLTTTSEESDDTFPMQPEESVTENIETGFPSASDTVVPSRANKRMENGRVVETLPETPKLSTKVSKRTAGDRSPPFRRREEKKRDKPTGRPAAVLGAKKRMEEKKGEGKDFHQSKSGDNNNNRRHGARKQLFPNEENAVPNVLQSKDHLGEEKLDQSRDDRPRKHFNPERMRYLSSNQLGATFVCVEGCSYTVTNGTTTISEDDVGNSWRDNLLNDLENLGTDKNLFLVGNDSRKAWKDIKKQFPGSVRETYLDDTHAGKCTYCEKSDCHRWKVIVAGLQTMVKFKTAVIEH